MGKKTTARPPDFRTRQVSIIECDLCPAKAYTAVLPIPACKDNAYAAAFAGRGWRVYRHPQFGTLQVCRRCGRKLGPQWSAVDPAEQEART